MSVINVDPAKKDDAFYRYKMPAMMIKIEGNGNGIKTVFPNIHDIAIKLNRPTESLSKFLGIELGAQSTYDKQNDKFLIMGSHTQERIQEKVYDYIKRFVLCKSCRNPETDPSVHKTKLSMTCRGCGKTTDLSSGERINNFLVLHYKKSTAPKAAYTAPPTGAAAATTEVEAEEEVVSPVVVTKEQAKIQSTADDLNRANPITSFGDLVHQVPTPDIETLIQKVFTLKTEFNLKDALVIRLIFRGTLEGVDAGKFIGKLQEQVELLRHFAANVPDLQEVCLKELLFACSGHNAPEKVPMGLKMLWEEGVVSDAAVIEWYETYKLRNKEISPAFFAEAKKCNAPFVAWLQESE